MDRFTTDTPKDNTETMLNYAFAKDKEVYLRYADNKEDVSLTEYIAEKAKKRSCEATKEDVFEGMCMECDHCELALLNVVSIQAAELRERLRLYEDTGYSPEELAKITSEIDSVKRLHPKEAMFIVVPKTQYDNEIFRLMEKTKELERKLKPTEPNSIYEDEAICHCCSEVIDETDSNIVCVHCGQVIDWRNW